MKLITITEIVRWILTIGCLVFMWMGDIIIVYIFITFLIITNELEIYGKKLDKIKKELNEQIKSHILDN